MDGGVSGTDRWSGATVAGYAPFDGDETGRRPPRRTSAPTDERCALEVPATFGGRCGWLDLLPLNAKQGLRTYMAKALATGRADAEKCAHHAIAVARLLQWMGPHSSAAWQHFMSADFDAALATANYAAANGMDYLTMQSLRDAVAWVRTR